MRDIRDVIIETGVIIQQREELKKLQEELDYIKKSDNLVIDSYKLEVQELNVALEAAAEIFKNLHVYCFTLDSHWGLEINKWLNGYNKLKNGEGE